MSNLEFLKKEAKNLLKDWKTQTKTVESNGSVSYSYSPKFYDVKNLFLFCNEAKNDKEKSSKSKSTNSDLSLELIKKLKKQILQINNKKSPQKITALKNVLKNST